jgi:DNA-directed RNA polymerase subunit RPC12/RpoP
LFLGEEMKCEKCGKEIGLDTRTIRVENKVRNVCNDCYDELILKERKKYTKCGFDDDRRKKFQYINIANPIILGIYIGVGLFIVLPLLVVGAVIILAIVMAVLGGGLGYLF